MPSPTPALTFNADTMKLSDGRTVIEIAEAMGPHPHPQHNGKLVPISTVQMLLVENANGDPVEMFACDWPGGDICGRAFDNVKSVTSHQTFHSPTKGSSHYSVETLKHVIRTVKTFRRDMGIRGHMEAAAKLLNEQNIPTAQGDPWTPQSVGSLYRHWEKQIPVRIQKRREHVDPPVNTKEVRVSTAAPKITGNGRRNPVTRIEQLFTDLAQHLTDASRAMSDLHAEVFDLAQQVQKYGSVNDEIRDKADKYDALRSMLNQ